MVLRFFLFAAIFLLASCTDFERNNPEDTGSINYVASELSYQGETYQTVKIGSQTWFKRNLNYAVDGSVCYDNSPDKCATYGRLYDWATAMKLSSSCNASSCAASISPKHQGICPNGWHIPSDADWEILMNTVGDNPGAKLKATSGWNNSNGYDIFGFAALPGGYGSSDGDFDNFGGYGYWWSASENDANIAYYKRMDYNYEGVFWYDANKLNYLFSIRCLKN